MLLGVIEFGGKTWITSKKLHEDMRPTQRVSDTNQAIRGMPTYRELIDNDHIIEVTNDLSKEDGSGVLPLLIKSNSYKPVMLIDPVAQKEIEHHFAESVSQAIHSSRENALLGVAGINLAALSRDPTLVALVRALSDQAELKESQARHERLLQNIQGVQKQLSHDYQKMTLTSEQVQEINSALDTKYHEHDRAGWVRGKIQGGLKRKFLSKPIGSLTWKDIASENFEEALEYVNCWVPDEE